VIVHGYDETRRLYEENKINVKKGRDKQRMRWKALPT
jgi:hypothetical protein